MKGTNVRQTFLVAAVIATALSGCKTASEEIAQGETLSQQKKYDEALETYRDVLGRPDLSAAEKERALRGRGEAFLAKGDLVNAEGAFRSLPPQSGARPALLGHVAYLRRDTAEAERLYGEAYTHGERGLVTTRLAEIVGGEATDPSRLQAAAKIVREGGGDAALAQALDEAASVWSAAEQGTAAPASLLARLAKAKDQAPRYVSLELIRADLLARSGQSEKASTALIDIASFDPKPSETFLKFVRQKQIRASVFTGDTTLIEKMADAGKMPPEEAARVRADIARNLEASGSFTEALERYKKTATAGGAPAGRAWCEVARLQAIRGDSAAAAEAWQKAASVADPDPATRALVAMAQARGQDPLGAIKALDAVLNDASLESPIAEDCSRLLRAAQRLRTSLDLVARAELARARTVERAALALAPDMSLALVLDGAFASLETGKPADAALALEGAAAGSETAAAIGAARIGILLEAGLQDDALKGADKRPDVVEALARLVPGVVHRQLVAAKTDDALSLVEKLAAATLDEAGAAQRGALFGRLRADAAYQALWSKKRFTDAAGAPDPLARKAPYCAELTLASGADLGVVRVVSADASGLVAHVPGRTAPVKVPASELLAASLRGVEDEAFERVDKVARSTASGRLAGEEGE
jgi:tetratricopeptide (TPR) repeat protein